MSAKSVLLEPQHLLDPTLEHTLIVVKPDGYARGLTGEILRRIEAKGYTIKGLKLMIASRELLAIIVEGQRVVEGMRVLMGSTDPTTAPAGTIRGDLGRAWNSPHMENLIHGSDSVDNATREISLWFPEIY